MIRVAAGLLRKGGRVLICRRRRGGPFGLKWEFPGGKMKEGETPESALCRELLEELSVCVPPEKIRSLQTLRHRYPEGPDVEIHFFEVDEFAGEPANLCFEEIAWVAAPELPGFDFLEADRPLVARIAAGGVVCGD